MPQRVQREVLKEGCDHCPEVSSPSPQGYLYITSLTDLYIRWPFFDPHPRQLNSGQVARGDDTRGQSDWTQWTRCPVARRWNDHDDKLQANPRPPSRDHQPPGTRGL